MKRFKFVAMATASAVVLSGTSAFAQTFDIQSATGSGSHQNFPPSKAIDGDLDFSSRWAGNGLPEELLLDLGFDQRVDDVRIAWARGDRRTTTFEIAGRSGTSGDWTTIYSGTSSGSTADFENYNVNDMDARQIRIQGLSNSANKLWTHIAEVEIIGTGGQSNTPTPTPTPTESSETYVLELQNTVFSMGGAEGAQEGQQVYLQDTNTSNVNQHWVETSISSTYNQYKKANTTLCLDGHDGGARSQPVTLETCDINNINQHWKPILQDGETIRLKKRGVSFSVTCKDVGDEEQFCYLWNSNTGNANQRFSFLTADSTPTPTPTPTPSGDFGLDPNAPPWENFDLREWKLDTPAGQSSSTDCKAQKTEPQDWDNDFLSSRSAEFFFTHTDGGMRFTSEYGGGTTGGDCDSKSRSELREMLRGSDTDIDTTGKNGDFRNNWALGYQPNTANADESWGAREGRMRATLIVNDVTESGSDNDQGNIVIGQIHASEDEPLRLHYRIRPGQTKGCVWAASEIREGDDVNFNIIGDRDCDSTDGPSDGIALGELFSYEIQNDGAEITVILQQGDRGSVIATETINLNDLNSGYDRDDEWMYFKAGVYSQNDDGDIGDRDIVTFYRLDVNH